MTVYIFVRIADSCRIETYVLSDKDKNWEDTHDLLIDIGWRLSNTRVFSV